jgi:hypothetical protein
MLHPFMIHEGKNSVKTGKNQIKSEENNRLSLKQVGGTKDKNNADDPNL